MTSDRPRQSRYLGVTHALVAGELVAGDVEVAGDPAGSERIIAVGVERSVGEDRSGPGFAVDADVGPAALLLPGLVDLQVNGFAGVDFRSADVHHYATAAMSLASCGVTAFAPTLHSQTAPDHLSGLSVLRDAVAAGPPGARLLPAHLEGPFLAERFAGAHDPRFLCAPDPALVVELLEAGPVAMVTLAPELPGALEVIEMLTAAGVVVSIGHTDADVDQCRCAFDAGAAHLTHCWNAHRRLSARDPGPAGAALADERITVGLIADGVHVADEVLGLTMRVAAGRVAATCDAIALAGHRSSTPGGITSPSGGVDDVDPVTVVDGAARLADGTIAGGVATPDRCLRHLVGLGVDLAAAVDACGGAQRRLLGLDPVELAVGERLDAVIVDGPDSLRPVQTYVDGRLAWSRA